MRPIFARALRQHAALLLAASSAAIVFELLVVYVVAQLDSGPGIRTLMETMLPPAMRALAFEQLGIVSFPGAVSFGFQHPLTLVTACALMIVIGTVPAAEREQGWLDLVLARPLTRTRYLAAHILLLLLAAIVVPAALLAAAAWGLAIVDGPGELPWTRYVPAAAALAPLLLLVGAYSLLFAARARRRGPAVARAVGLTLLCYWLDFMGGFWDALRDLRWLSPFTWFDPARAAIGAGLGWRDPLLLLGCAALCLLLAPIAFRRQDL